MKKAETLRLDKTTLGLLKKMRPESGFFVCNGSYIIAEKIYDGQLCLIGLAYESDKMTIPYALVEMAKKSLVLFYGSNALVDDFAVNWDAWEPYVEPDFKPKGDVWIDDEVVTNLQLLKASTGSKMEAVRVFADLAGNVIFDNGLAYVSSGHYVHVQHTPVEEKFAMRLGAIQHIPNTGCFYGKTEKATYFYNENIAVKISDMPNLKLPEYTVVKGFFEKEYEKLLTIDKQTVVNHCKVALAKEPEKRQHNSLVIELTLEDITIKVRPKQILNLLAGVLDDVLTLEHTTNFFLINSNILVAKIN